MLVSPTVVAQFAASQEGLSYMGLLNYTFMLVFIRSLHQFQRKQQFLQRSILPTHLRYKTAKNPVHCFTRILPIN
jgi:hypothetical protein